MRFRTAKKVFVVLIASILIVTATIIIRSTLSLSTRPDASAAPSMSTTFIPVPSPVYEVYEDSQRKFKFEYLNTWTYSPSAPDSDPQIAYFEAPEWIENDFRYLIVVEFHPEITVPTYSEANINGQKVLFSDKLPGRSGSLTAFISMPTEGFIGLSLTPYNSLKPFPKQQEHLEVFNRVLRTFMFL